MKFTEEDPLCLGDAVLLRRLVFSSPGASTSLVECPDGKHRSGHLALVVEIRNDMHGSRHYVVRRYTPYYQPVYETKNVLDVDILAVLFRGGNP